MKISLLGLNGLMKDEGCVLKAYQDTGGVWTIGYGHTKGVKQGDVITKEKASQYLIEDMRSVEYWIGIQGLTLNQNQFDALCDFVYNCGAGNFIKWGFLAMIKSNPNNPEIADKLREHVYDRKGNKLPGLVKRREKEIKLYFSKE